MRTTFAALVLVVAATAQGGVTFLTPPNGAQAIGPQVLEVTSDAANVDRVEFRVDGVLAGIARTAPYRVVFDFGTELASRDVSATVLSDGYRISETAMITTAALTAGETMNVDLVEVPLRVRSSRRLAISDIRVRENSVEQSVREILPLRGPAHFAFVVDRSLSMAGGRLAGALAAVSATQKLLRDGDTASLVLFNHHVSPAEPVRDVADRELTPSGGTSLRDAVASAVDGRAGRTYVIVITDGGDRNSVLTEEAALRAISGTKTIVSAVVLGSASRFLKRAAETTGGTLLSASSSTLRGQTERILADINSRYTVVYQSLGTAAGWRTIAVEARRSGIDVVAARKGYFAQ